MGFFASSSKPLVDEIRAAAGRRVVDVDRATLCSNVAKMLANNFADVVEAQVRSMFHAENYEHLRLHIHSTTNVLRRVVHEVARAYQEPAFRWVKGLSREAARMTVGGRLGGLLALSDERLSVLGETGVEEAPEEDGTEEPVEAAPPEAGDERASAAIDAYLAEADLDTVMAAAQRLAMVMPVVWIFPAARKDEDGKVRLRFALYTPYSASADADPMNPAVAQTWRVWVREKPKKKGDLPKRVAYEWTSETIRKVDEDGREVKDGDPIVGDGVNRLGRIPVTTLRLGLPAEAGGYYLDGQGGDLYDATVELCVLRTLQNARYRDSSFKQLVIDGDPENVPADQVMGNPARPIFVSEGTATVLDLQANLDALSAVVRERLQEIASAYGISPSAWALTGSERVQSGFSKKMDSAKVLGINRDHRKWLLAAEQDLFRLVATGVERGVYDLPELAGMPTEAEFVVDFADPRFEEEPLTQAKADALDIEMGKLSILDVLMRDNPDLTEEEALALLARNRMINERFAGTGAKEKGASVMEILAGLGAPAKPGEDPNVLREAGPPPRLGAAPANGANGAEEA